ncbi:spermidine/putrescine transport system permease protein [Modicisalibacter xianhensis]|uniref:Spermidine/putrescine transport system permease protein n=1 Tax=Modicisalibacter xianhensis TaxID=442341 RepID=A0A4R8G0J0_9GAMM|nr:ABC transporter permease [Halomonas xianhensis]TDX33023.1 spermidine/putrescine transport system permease protein [Halomonas xianhensis]
MSAQRFFDWGLRLYIGLFFIYLFLPLAIMAMATFNDSRFPTITPWNGTTLKWFAELWADGRMWAALGNSLLVAGGVLCLAVPIGVASALFLTTVESRAKPFVYGLILSPLLTPGVIIGISTLIFWREFGVSGGTFLTVLGQATFISAYVMLMVMARLQRFDRTLERAALDLGATPWQAFRRVLLPFLKPAILSAAVIAFLQSFENYNTSLFVVGYDTTLTVYIASKVRTGLTPAVNALGLVLIVITVLIAIVYELKRRRELKPKGV